MNGSASSAGRGPARPALPLFTPTALSGAELDDRTVGREALIERMLGFLRTAATSRNRPHMLIIGPRGSGKTHALAVVLHRAAHDAKIARRLAFAWIPEDAVGISSYEDLFVATVEHLLGSSPGDRRTKQATLDNARLHRGGRDAQALEDLVRELLGDRVLVLVLENLDRIFAELGENGQARLRNFMETTGDLLLLASTPLLFDAVSDRDRPWFGSFHIEHLEELSVEQGSMLLEHIAIESGDDELAIFLTTDDARARMRTVSHLAGGSPRMWMVLAGCMTMELLEELARLVEVMLDQLAPYYQQRLWDLSPNERKLVTELCRTATVDRDGRIVHEQAGMRTVADLAAVCGIDQRVAGTALAKLLTARWVRRDKPDGTDGRTTWYEVREPLLRHHMQYRETRGEPLRVIVGFLQAWYVLQERRRRLADVEPGSVSELYLRKAVMPELRASDSLYDAAIPEDLISGARLLLDDDGEGPRFASRSVSTGIVAEAVALDAWRGRSHALHACRSRLASLDTAHRESLCDVLAAALSTTGQAVSSASILSPTPARRRSPPLHQKRTSLTAVQTDIANGLTAAVPVADGRLQPHDRITLRLLTAGWTGICGMPDRACALLAETAQMAREIEAGDVELRLAVDADLAYFLFVSGRRREGNDLCALVLAERAAALGTDHPDTLRSRANLAGFVGADGDHASARDLFASLAADSERVLGAQHPDTLANRHHHAFYVGEAGARKDARELFAALADDCGWTLGAEHPRTLGSRHMHAHYVGAAGAFGAARDLYSTLAADCERSLGAEHPETLAWRHQHAYWVAAAGHRSDASELFADIAADRERLLGADHPATLTSHYYCASCMNHERSPETAALLAGNVFMRSYRALGAHASLTRSSRGLLVDVLSKPQPARSLVTGGAARLSAAVDAMLRLDSALATELLTALCVATSRVDGSSLPGAVDRLAERAVRTGRSTELGAAVMRALLGMGAERRAPWIAKWVQASEARQEHAVMHRMLRATRASFRGDPTRLLALPAEEQRIVAEIVEGSALKFDPSDPWGE